VKAVLKYPGAKNRIAPWIVENMPIHNVYLEPFYGSGAVLNHKPRCHIETVNDLNGDVVNFHKVLRDSPEDFIRVIELTPWSRDEYNKSFEDCTDAIEKARRYAVRCWQGFGGSNAHRNGFKSGQQTKSPDPAKGWSKLPETLWIATERLKGVQIENLPAKELIERYDTPDVFIYLDPPYLQGTRKGYLYKHEMNNNEHEELLEQIIAHPGMIMISGHDSDTYNDKLVGWRKLIKVTQVEQGLKRTEVIWMNYLEGQRNIFDFMKGD